MNEKETILEDCSIVAFCSLLEIQKKYHLKVIPFKQKTGRIAFIVRGDAEGAISEIYQNRKVCINDYIKTLKATRHAIFTLRGLGNNQEAQHE